MSERTDIPLGARALILAAVAGGIAVLAVRAGDVPRWNGSDTVAWAALTVAIAVIEQFRLTVRHGTERQVYSLADALFISGLLTAPEQGSFDQNLMQAILIYAFAAAVLGGLESPAGAVVGGFILGVGLNLLTTYVGFVTPEIRLPVALAALFAVLVMRPTGLFGRAAVRKV